MKYFITLFILAFSFTVHAQTDKIVFEYDAAGNQVKRYLCLNCPSTTGKNDPPKEEVAALEDESLQKFFSDDVISYYPNPVKEELFLKWELTNGNTVSTLQVYGINGMLLQSLSNLEKTDSQTLAFGAYQAGIYMVVLNYNNGEQKTIKIVKQ